MTFVGEQPFQLKTKSEFSQTADRPGKLGKSAVI